MDNFKVVFSGFETEEQAKHFANWFEGQGEQDCSIWMEEHAKINAVNVDMSKYAKQGGFTANKENEIIVPVTIYK
jgi:hypothetical protein